MILGGSVERLQADDERCTFDPPAPWAAFHVVDPEARERVACGQRGQVVMNHVSKGFLVPNNLERDMAIRVEPPNGKGTAVGDSASGVGPVATLDDEAVVEGVYWLDL
ncbi:hypothetical protein ACWCQQ_32005 [Streptomyces sp. NPDC002143]